MSNGLVAIAWVMTVLCGIGIVACFAAAIYGCRIIRRAGGWKKVRRDMENEDE